MASNQAGNPSQAKLHRRSGHGMPGPVPRCGQRIRLPVRSQGIPLSALAKNLKEMKLRRFPAAPGLTWTFLFL
jgi:hypothetical protein